MEQPTGYVLRCHRFAFVWLLIYHSPLVNLKAELSRKQEEARQAKSKAKGETVIPKQIHQTLTDCSKKNHGIDKRIAKDVQEMAEEEASCRKSRIVLENKAKLYETLSQGQGDLENDNRYLVDFEKKSLEQTSKCIDPEHTEVDEEEIEQIDSDDYDNPSDPEDDWVDYRDCLGRTRRCLRKDLIFLKEKDAKLADSLGMCDPVAEKGNQSEQVLRSKASTSTDTSEKVESVQENLELISGDMKRQELRLKWEKQEEELKEKTDVHYQDVLFDEVRTHGVAYYAFSKDEKSRQAEQQDLQKLRVETERGQTAASDLRARRKEQMASRLKAARARKRAREGLPPEAEEDEENENEDKVEDEASTAWPDCKAAEMVQAEEEERDRRKARVEEAEERRKRMLERRPPPVRPWDVGKEGADDLMSQEEWVKRRREERNLDFAPPAEFIHHVEDITPAEEVMITDAGWSTSHLRGSSRNSRRNLSQLQKGKTTRSPVRIISDIQKTDDFDRKRAEIPPPATFDYYGPSSSKQNLQQVKQNQNLDAAISAGLSYLRQQAEERDKQKEKGLLDII